MGAQSDTSTSAPEVWHSVQQILAPIFVPGLLATYLDLLRFFLNHRRFMRSRLAERVGKSPRELMTGESHPHWLTLLGFGPLQNQRA